MAEVLPRRNSDATWKSAFFGVVGVIMAIVLVVGVFAAGPRVTSSIQPPWPSSYPFGLGSDGSISPYSFGWAAGTGTNDSCLFLFVEFNASTPVDLWVLPGGSGYVVRNGTPYFSSILWSVGPAMTGRNAIELAHGGGYVIATANPGPTEAWVYVSDETLACVRFLRPPPPRDSGGARVVALRTQEWA